MRTVKAIKKPIIVTAQQLESPMSINTLEGTMHANTGDWLITGVHNEQWAIKAEIFNETYTIIEQEP